jgi:hypothetical protein
MNLRSRPLLKLPTWTVSGALISGGQKLHVSTSSHKAHVVRHLWVIDLFLHIPIGFFQSLLAQCALGIIGTIGSWFLMSYAGRPSIYLYGTMILFYLLMIIGLISFAPVDN